MRKLLINKKALVREDGFTLIELLVVIAIIGILAAIVLIGINPAARINETNGAKAQADTRQAASVIEACLTKQLGSSAAATAYTDCATTSLLQNNSFARAAFPTTTVASNAGSQVCITSTVGSQNYYYSTSTGQTSNGKASGC